MPVLSYLSARLRVTIRLLGAPVRGRTILADAGLDGGNVIIIDESACSLPNCDAKRRAFEGLADVDGGQVKRVQFLVHSHS